VRIVTLRKFAASAWVTAFCATAILAQTFELRPAPRVQLPSPTDSNSPAHWLNGSLVLFNAMGIPLRSEGLDQFSLYGQSPVSLLRGTPSPLWIEATWLDDDGVLFAWYHHEPGGVCGGIPLTAPKIGALVSYDNGYSFRDLGFVLESGDPVDCRAENGYFAGGNGDFTVILDAAREHFYFLFSNYGGDSSGQGIAIARMPFASRFNPRGSVLKYYNGAFSEPGIGGQLTPIFPAAVSWSSPSTDAFWGPSVHWNTALNQYVMLLNHSCCSPGWPQEGVYLSLNRDLADPLGWSPPLRLVEGGGWYPQVLGEDPGSTDKLAGAVSRFYMYGISDFELVASPDTPTPSAGDGGDDPPPPDPSQPADPEARQITGHRVLRIPPRR